MDTLTLRYEGRNNQGMRVLAARCVCGWVHMTAYPLFRKRRSALYLRRRFTDHLYESWASQGCDKPCDRPDCLEHR